MSPRADKEGKNEARKEIVDLLKSGKSPEEIIREYDSQEGGCYRVSPDAPDLP